MKKLLSLVCIFTAIAYQSAQAQGNAYESAGYGAPEYVEVNGVRYARIPQENTRLRYDRQKPQRYESQPHFTRLNQEQSKDVRFKREVIHANLPTLHPYVGIDGALGTTRYKSEDDKVLLGKSFKRVGIFGGLQFNQYVGLEAFYHWGEMKEKKNQISYTFSDLSSEGNVDYSAYGLDLMGYVPVSKQSDIILGLGYGWYDFDAALKLSVYNYTVDIGATEKYKTSHKDEAVRFSLGAQFLLTDSLAVRVLGRYMDFRDADVIKSMMEVSLGLRYLF